MIFATFNNMILANVKLRGEYEKPLIPSENNSRQVLKKTPAQLQKYYDLYHIAMGRYDALKETYTKYYSERQDLLDQKANIERMLSDAESKMKNADSTNQEKQQLNLN